MGCERRLLVGGGGQAEFWKARDPIHPALEAVGCQGWGANTPHAAESGPHQRTKGRGHWSILSRRVTWLGFGSL